MKGLQEPHSISFLEKPCLALLTCSVVDNLFLVYYVVKVVMNSRFHVTVAHKFYDIIISEENKRGFQSIEDSTFDSVYKMYCGD